MPKLSSRGSMSNRGFGFGSGVGRVVYTLTISANTQNYDVYTNRSPSYVAGSSDITVQINPGVTVGSSSVPSYALLVPSSFSPTDTITIINDGSIRGAGGTGGSGTPGMGTSTAPSGTAGGNAVYVNRPTTITNNGTVAGGGGGGGGGGSANVPAYPGGKNPPYSLGGAGGGGGGGAGDSVGVGGSGGADDDTNPASSTAGSPGANGTATTGGAGGNGGVSNLPSPPGVAGGTGGSGGGAGSAGSAGNPGINQAAATPYAGGSGGAAGNYITGNSFVTWPSTGTRQGGVA
jgi:hypothetical protein